jgi:DNA-directed RNA polymerase subunit RPC12/RpoP
VGQPIAEIGKAEIDERPRETTEDRCPYCGSGDVTTRGISAQAGAGAPVKEGYDCRACSRHFRRVRAQPS